MEGGVANVTFDGIFAEIPDGGRMDSGSNDDLALVKGEFDFLAFSEEFFGDEESLFGNFEFHGDRGGRLDSL
jgi:hypothetical protein